MGQKQGDPNGGAYQQLTPAWMRPYDIGLGLPTLPPMPAGIERFTAPGSPEVDVVLDPSVLPLLNGARPDVAPNAGTNTLAADTAKDQGGY